MSTSPLAIAGLFVSVFGVIMIWEHLESLVDLDPSLGKGAEALPSFPLPSTSTSPAMTLRGEDELVLWKEEEQEFEEEETLRGGSNESQLKSWRTHCMELESEKEQLKDRVKVLEEHLVQSREDQGKLREMLKEKVGEMGSMRREIASVRRRRERILSAELEQRLKERFSRAEELRKEVKKVWEMHEGMRGSLERALKEIERMKHELEEREVAVATLRKSLQEAEAYGGRVAELQTVLEALRLRLEQKRTRHWWRRSSWN